MEKCEEMTECSICHKKGMNHKKCFDDICVCEECGEKGLDVIFSICLSETSKDPIRIIQKMMTQPFCHIHGPEHHAMVGCALLCAYRNAGGEIDLKSSLVEMAKRAKCVPGGACGYWGACGASVATGMFVSIVTGSGPLKEEPWALSVNMTSRSLEALGKIGGPRCCKRDSYLSILTAVDYVKENLHAEMEKPVISCIHSAMNKQCIGERCPFHPEQKGE